MTKYWQGLGLLIVLSILPLASFSINAVHGDAYTYFLKASVDNTANYAQGLPAELNVTAYFAEGQSFFFNFTKGRFWGTQYDQEYGLYPANIDFAPNEAIVPYKTVEFLIYTPSGNVVHSLVYMVAGAEPFAVTYLDQSADFTPLPGGNLTFTNVGLEGIAERTGNYTFEVFDIEPWVMRDANQTYMISSDPLTGDPPATMSLYNIVFSQTLIPGDLNGDGKVNLQDLQLLAQAYNSKPRDPNWNPAADIAPPYGIIGLTDLVTLAMHYGQHSP